MASRAWLENSATWLIICDPGDAVSHWAHRQLQERGFDSIELISGDMLGAGLRWEHRIGAGGALLRLELAAGRRISSRTVQGVLNQLRQVPHWRAPEQIAGQDRQYARQELTAFFIAWLSSFRGPILNPVTPQGLSGRERHLAEWMALAHQAGLPTDTFRESTAIESEQLQRDGDWRSTTLVVVVGSTAMGAAPRSLLRGRERLAALSATPLLGVALRSDDEASWRFVGATPHPDLRRGGARAMDELALALRSGRRLG